MSIGDQDLIQQLLSSQPSLKEKGWQLIYKTHFPAIRKMVLNLNGAPDDAIDIFQDGLLIFHRNLKNGTFRQESAVKTYIFSICRRLWLKEYQKRQKKQLTETEIIDNSPEDFQYIKNIEAVGTLMAELREDCYKILTEYYYNKKSMNELKDIFNLGSIQAVKNKKWRCLNYLVNLFKQKGVSYMKAMDNE